MVTESELLKKLETDFKNKTFTAIDFETANENKHSACSVGLAVVEKGNITQTEKFLVRPPDMYFREDFIKIHGITKSMVRWAPKMSKVWRKIRKSIQFRILVAHNASFDEQVLNHSLGYYGIDHGPLAWFCTLNLSRQFFPELQNHKLGTVCKHLNIGLNHHDPESDAIAAAQIVLKAFEIDPELGFFFHGEDLQTEKKGYKKDHSSHQDHSHKKIKSETLKQDLNEKYQNHPFYERKVVFTGDLSSLTRQEAAQYAKSRGADVNVSISKKTDFVVIGTNPGPKKMERINQLVEAGYGIQIINEKQFTKIHKSS